MGNKQEDWHELEASLGYRVSQDKGKRETICYIRSKASLANDLLKIETFFYKERPMTHTEQRQGRKTVTPQIQLKLE